MVYYIDLDFDWLAGWPSGCCAGLRPRERIDRLTAGSAPRAQRQELIRQRGQAQSPC